MKKLSSRINKITIVTGIYPPDIGGPATFIPSFAKHISTLGIGVEVITLGENFNSSTCPFLVTRIKRSLWHPLRSFLVIIAIIKSARNSDLIFSNTLDFESAISSIILRKKRIQKVVGDIAWERASLSARYAGTLDDYQNAKLDYRSILTNFYRNFSVWQACLIITPSSYLERVVRNWTNPKKKIQVIYNNVEFKQRNKILKKDKFRLISIARLIPHKGIESILLALKELSFDFEYIVIGDGPLRTHLEKMAKNFRLDVSFIRSVDKQEISNWLSSSDLFILNSSYEGLPHVIIEAMSHSCLVLASKVGGTVELVNDGVDGFLFDYNKIEQISNAVNELYSNPELRERISNSAKKKSKKFTDSISMTKRYLDLFEENL